VVLGNCFGAFGFLAHEILHGSVFRNTKLAEVIAFPMLIPMFISPTYWKFWHNRLHHGKTQQLISDPDAYPTTRVFKHSKFMNFMFPFTPGSGHLRSYLYFFVWFSINSFVSQIYMRYRNNLYDQANHKRIAVEFYSILAIWAGFLWWAGPSNILYVWIIPYLAQNYFVMSYIATNHNLSPLTKVNDPLANSLTVTNHPILEVLHFNFGYHVEHHIFPTMSGAYTKHVHEILKADYPKTYHYMPKWKAMRMLYKSARIYKNSKTLINPETGKTFPTIGSPETT
jgi:fatty acid desaturase